MHFHVLTLFPEQIERACDSSILQRAQANGLIQIDAVNIRDYTENRHGKVDDYLYGGGAGLLMQAQPVYDAYQSVIAKIGEKEKRTRVVYLTPQGSVFNQNKAAEFSKEEDLILLCGHYEGIDERVLEEIVTDEISIGDFVLTGGELPAVMMIDAISRLLPGVLGNDQSAAGDSFQDGLLEYPQYTRPETWMEKSVPKVLLSGDHAKIEEWRLVKSLQRTKKKRPDLFNAYLTEVDMTGWKPAQKKRWKRIMEQVEEKE